MRLAIWGSIGLASIAVAVWAGEVVIRELWPRQQSIPAAPLPALYIADDKQDLGEVWDSKDALLTVPISNSTNRDIEILDFETSCDCGEVSPRKLTVPAKGAANVTVKMDLTRRTPNQIGMVRRRFTLTLRPLIREREIPSELVFHWITRSAVTLKHSEIIFDNFTLQDVQPTTRKIGVMIHAAKSAMRIEVKGVGVSASLHDVDGCNAEILIGFESAFGLPSREAEVIICAIDQSGTTVSDISLRVSSTSLRVGGSAK